MEGKKCVDTWQELIVIAGGKLEVNKWCIAIMYLIQKKGQEVIAALDQYIYPEICQGPWLQYINEKIGTTS